MRGSARRCPPCERDYRTSKHGSAAALRNELINPTIIIDYSSQGFMERYDCPLQTFVFQLPRII